MATPAQSRWNMPHAPHGPCFTLTLTAVPAGTMLKLRVSRVKATGTGTTATSIAWLA